MTARPPNLTPAELRAEADRMEQAEANRRRAQLERDERRRAATAHCEEAATVLRAELDAVLGEVRTALPGCEQWWPRIAAALRQYDEATAEARAASVVVGSSHRPSTILQQHPINRVGELLRNLQDRAPGRGRQG